MTAEPSWRLVGEPEFHAALMRALACVPDDVRCVMGPGRSGAVAAVYASHILHVPFLPYGATVPGHLRRLLLIDTARQTGKTLRKAENRYREADPFVLAVFEEPPRVVFWYEASKPQRFRHEAPVLRQGGGP